MLIFGGHNTQTAMSHRPFGTCFFEQYAQITLSTLLGGEFVSLVGRDRPDLQSADGHTLGIEVTRAMEQSKDAAAALMADISGTTPAPQDGVLAEILETGYAYGLEGGRYIGTRELSYWALALPLRRIIQSKVYKVGNGFYGHFDKTGLFVFCKDQLGEVEAFRTLNYTLGLQRSQELRYDRLYLADIDDLFVCNLADGLQPSSRLSRHPITQQQRKDFFREAVRRQEGE